MRSADQIGIIRFWLVLFMIGMLISGLTAVPLMWLTHFFADLTAPLGGQLADWSATVASAVAEVDGEYPFLFYGTDWLAFAHIVIALVFIGPIREPVRNKWVVQWGLIACALVVVVSFVWAPVRDIPFFWRCVDASFGVIGAIPLWLALRKINEIESIPLTHR
jgi:hypothetical protein